MKLIRDKLALTPYPGPNPRAVILVNKETQQSLIFDKILEEAFELFNARTDEDILSELADLEDAIARFKVLHNISQVALDGVKIAKDSTRGSFSQGYALV